MREITLSDYTTNANATMRFVVSLMCLYFLYGSGYLGEGNTDQRESLHDGTEMCSRTNFSSYGGDRYLYGSPNGESRKGLGGPFLASQTPIFAIWLRIPRKW